MDPPKQQNSSNLTHLGRSKFILTQHGKSSAGAPAFKPAFQFVLRKITVTVCCKSAKALTCFTGWFGYIEASGREPQSYADLQLPNIADSPAYCLNFYYHMLGIYIGQLDVISDGTVIWSQVGGTCSKTFLRFYFVSSDFSLPVFSAPSYFGG